MSAAAKLRAALTTVATGAILGCEAGGKTTVQVGYRGVGEEQYYDNSELRRSLVANRAPAPLPPAGPSIQGQWQNVQVLTDVSANEFNRTMLAMTQWVSPQQGCNYCHVPTNFASDSLWTKVVARRMLQMTRDANANWRAHVGQTGVTCFTCHRGQPIPQAGLWYFTDENQYLRAYLDRADVRVQSYTALPTAANRSSIKQTENTYALMLGMSRSLGVNCTFCHNSRSWSTWQNAPPARITALYGLRMVRHFNTEYLVGLDSVMASSRLGPLGDAPKLQCLTCHQGAFKPLYGARMAADYPALWGHPGPWRAALAGDSTAVGVVDLRGADSIPHDGAPRLPPVIPRSRPAPVPAAPHTPASGGGQR
ncbi:MAG: photosynthetic reaction center cytochrome PufC [Gemmatirosa sp.]